MKNKAFTTTDVRDITDQWFKNQITFSRMVELLNEKANEFILDYLGIKDNPIKQHKAITIVIPYLSGTKSIGDLSEIHAISRNRINAHIKLNCRRAHRFGTDDEKKQLIQYDIRHITKNKALWLELVNRMIQSWDGQL